MLASAANVSLRSDGSQQVLLGVGLAVAVMAFIDGFGNGDGVIDQASSIGASADQVG